MRVGDYVRTKSGKIVKCFKSESMNKPIYYVIGSATNSYIEYQDVVKSSPNIIDLIEVGDYVNGFKIDDITEKDKDHPERIAWHLTYYGDDIPFRNDEIKSIVTREQFSSMEYKVESEVK